MTKKVESKKVASKKVAKKAKRKSVDETRSIKASPGNESHFYKGFPRALAYALLVKAPKRTLKVAKFLDKIEKLKGVKNRAAAKGIVAKILNKPGDDGVRNGAIARYV